MKGPEAAEGRPQAIKRFAFPALLALFVLLAVATSLIVPLGEAPDEVSHHAYVEYLVAHQTLPQGSGEVTGEAKQPPLYYFLGALLTSFIPRGDFQVIANPDFSLTDTQAQNVLLHTRREAFPYDGAVLAWHVERLLSVALAAITIWATWQLGLEITGSQWVAFSAAVFVSFLPQFLFISSTVNNDNLVTALASLAILQTVRLLKRGSTLRAAAILGVLVGLAALAKLSGLVLLPWTALAFLWLVWKQRNVKRIVSHAAVCFGVAALFILPLAGYNWLRYGDPLGWQLITSVSDIRQSSMTLSDWLSLGRALLLNFAGHFGGVSNIPIGTVPLVLVLILILLGLLGWIGYARDWRRGKLLHKILVLAVMFISFWAVLLLAWARWSISALGTDQSRLLFPGISLLALGLAAGLSRWSNVHRTLITGLWSTGFFALALTVPLYLYAVYLPTHGDSAISAGDQVDIRADFGRTIRLTDFQVTPTSVSAGHPITVYAGWESLRPAHEDYWLLLQLTGPGGPVAGKDGVPSAGRLTTDWWETGQVLNSHHTLMVPSDLPAGRYTLQLGLHPFGRWEWLQVRGQDMLPLRQIVVGP